MYYDFHAYTQVFQAPSIKGTCIHSGFYLGIFVWGGSSGEGTAQDARLVGGPGNF